MDNYYTMATNAFSRHEEMIRDTKRRRKPERPRCQEPGFFQSLFETLAREHLSFDSLILADTASLGRKVSASSLEGVLSCKTITNLKSLPCSATRS